MTRIGVEFVSLAIATAAASAATAVFTTLIPMARAFVVVLMTAARIATVVATIVHCAHGIEAL